MRYFIFPLRKEKINDTKKGIDNGEISDQLNLISKYIQASIFLSHNIRKNSIIILSDNLNNLIIIYGDKLKYMGTDLRSISILILKAINRLSELKYRREIISTPGIVLEKISLLEFLNKNKENSLFLYYDYKNNKELPNKISNKNFFLIHPEIVNTSKDLKEEFSELKLLSFSFNQDEIHFYEIIIIFNNYLDRTLNE